MIPLASPRKRIRKAIGSLLSTNRFFGVLSLRMNVVPGQVETIAGDGITLTYNPEWVAEAPHDQIKGAIAHIVFACALKHHVRRGERDYGRWNRASRIVAGEFLKRENIWVPGGLNPWGPTGDLPVEVIYDRLDDQDEKDQQQPRNQPQGASGAGSGQGQGQNQPSPQDGTQDQQGGGRQQQQKPPPPGEIQDAPKEKKEEQDKSWDRASKQAAQISKSTGSDPGNAEQAFEDQHFHRRDWQDILREYMRSAAPTDYSWSRPNRRFIDSGLYLPSLHGQGMGPIVIAIDTSGSVDDLHVNQALTEMFAITREVRPERIHLLQCDTRITDEQDFDPDDAPDEVTIKGRGGTSLKPIFRRVDERGIMPEVLIYMTDLEVSQWPDEPDYAVIWAVENDYQAAKAPFGEAVVIEPEAH